MAKKKKQQDLKIDYKTEAEPKAVAGGVPVFCAFDKIVPIADVIGNPKNPNRHPDTQIALLAQIIKSQGWRAPITVSNRSGFVVRGHGRLAAAVKLGVSEVPIDYQSYSNDAEEWADLIADNRIAELAETDNVALADLIQDMDTGEVPLILTGYSEDDLESLISSISGDDDTTDDGVDDVPAPPGSAYQQARRSMAPRAAPPHMRRCDEPRDHRAADGRTQGELRVHGSAVWRELRQPEREV